MMNPSNHFSIVVLGSPSSGKSTFVDYFSNHTNPKSNWNETNSSDGQKNPFKMSWCFQSKPRFAETHSCKDTGTGSSQTANKQDIVLNVINQQQCKIQDGYSFPKANLFLFVIDPAYLARVESDDEYFSDQSEYLQYLVKHCSATVTRLIFFLNKCDQVMYLPTSATPYSEAAKASTSQETDFVQRYIDLENKFINQIYDLVQFQLPFSCMFFICSIKICILRKKIEYYGLCANIINDDEIDLLASIYYEGQLQSDAPLPTTKVKLELFLEDYFGENIDQLNNSMDGLCQQIITGNYESDVQVSSISTRRMLSGSAIPATSTSTDSANRHDRTIASKIYHTFTHLF